MERQRGRDEGVRRAEGSERVAGGGHVDSLGGLSFGSDQPVAGARIQRRGSTEAALSLHEDQKPMEAAGDADAGTPAARRRPLPQGQAGGVPM